VTLPELERAEVTGSGDLTIRGFDCSSALRLQASGSSDLHFEGSAPKIRAQVSGSGDVYLQGTTDFAELSVSGSGTMDAQDLVAAEGDLSVTGSGRLTATVDGPVSASASGSGDIDLYGAVQRDRFSETGSGDIHVH
jgi:uncharacterized protein (AIM24 family)